VNIEEYPQISVTVHSHGLWTQTQYMKYGTKMFKYLWDWQKHREANSEVKTNTSLSLTGISGHGMNDLNATS